jgi:hypothetical protein
MVLLQEGLMGVDMSGLIIVGIVLVAIIVLIISLVKTNNKNKAE